MDTTRVVPKVPLGQFKRTKIIATVGPSSNDYETVKKLVDAGANGIRLNCSHGTPDDRNQHIKWIRKASSELGKPVAIIMDLQGPKIRLGDFDGIINVQKGQSLQFAYNSEYESSGHIPIQYDLSKKISRGHRFFLNDGKLQTVVTSVSDGVIHVKAENEGLLTKRKGINLPDTDFDGDIITKKDREDIALGVQNRVDYVALSFVQTAEDIEKLRVILKGLGSHAKIIAKIETRAAVDNLETIMLSSDVVMIARGDLAVETMAESVPVQQRHIIGLGRYRKRPTIVATQMLSSMTDQLEPTRAEVSDVATAVIVGADCVMLSEETASGKYPIEAVETMKRVIKYTEHNSTVKASFSEIVDDKAHENAISSAIINLAKDLSAKAIVAETKSGATAVQIASFRPEIPLIAVAHDETTANQLAIVYGIKSYARPADKYAATKLTNWLSHNKVLKNGDVIITASGKYPGVVGTTDTIKVRVI